MLRVVGLGNELYGDDGIGSAVLRHLQTFPVELVDAGNDGFKLLDYLLQAEPLLVIDCARMGKSPGSVCKFLSGRIHPGENCDLISLHGISMGEILVLARELGWSGECTIIGIEPKSIAFNTGLSAEVSGSIPAVIDLVMEEVEHYAKKSIDH
jgi:hydrogenase maturation protease